MDDPLLERVDPPKAPEVCRSNTDCGAATPVCHLPTGVCVGCVSNSDCGGATAICDVGSGACRGCASSADCGGTTPACHVPSGRCLECVSNADCSFPTAACNLNTSTCEAAPPQPVGSPCTVDPECESELCWDFGQGGRCTRSCNAPDDCDNDTTCHMFNGARICMNPNTAPITAEAIDCTTNADCTTGTLCVWVERSPGRWDQRCQGQLGNLQPQSQCGGDSDCRNGICTPGINSSSFFCRYTCSTDRDCPSNFACLYVDYPGQNFVQAVKACLPVDSPSPAICGVDADCATNELCKILDTGSDGSFQYLANVCLGR